jgi:DNA-binding response OmpR family regulator
MSTILIVADDRLIGELLCQALSEDGHTVLIAHCGETALSLLREHSGIDLLFTDIRDRDALAGYALAQEAKRLQPTLTVLYATEAAIERTRASNLPATLGVIRKPYGLGHVRTKIRGMVG